MINEKSAPGAFGQAMYPVAAALILFPISDIASRLYPPNFGNLQWRFAFLGLSMSALSVLLIGTALLGFTAALRGHRGVLRATSVFAGLIALMLVGGLLSFSLDTLQMRSMVQPQMKPALAKMALAGGIAGGLHFIGFAGLTVAAWRAAKRQAPVQAPATKAEAPMLVYAGMDK